MVIRTAPLHAVHEDVTYAFVDGAYFRLAVQNLMGEFFQPPLEVDFQRLRGALGAKRLFYYDCVYNKRRRNESKPQAKQRILEKRRFLNGLRSLDGIHVRLGVIAGDGKRQRQKEVDVRLAVDMLDHAYRGTYHRALLLAGDRDFKPVVDAVVQTGALVRVMAEKRSLNSKLAFAADSFTHLTLPWLYNSMTSEFQVKQELPTMCSGGNIPPKDAVEVNASRPGLRLLQSPNALFWIELPNHNCWASFADRSRLEDFARVMAPR
ncbi:MAG: NYN domain-containing protein [Planctomycetia bacterium]|nr:NYN domain-containing protein [Planctomycetia bacterium]